jgi:hypothetical protein
VRSTDCLGSEVGVGVRAEQGRVGVSVGISAGLALVRRVGAEEQAEKGQPNERLAAGEQAKGRRGSDGILAPSLSFSPLTSTGHGLRSDSEKKTEKQYDLWDGSG